MKTTATIALWSLIAIPVNTYAQTSTQVSVIRTVPYGEWSTNYPSLDTKGKYWTVLYATEVKTTNGRSLKDALEIHYVSEYPNLYKEATWYKWSPLDRCWTKFAKSGIEQNADQTRYLLQTKQPGIYSLMIPQKAVSKGLVIKVPKGYSIEHLKIRQNEPAIAMDIKPKKKSRKAEVPLYDLQFDTTIDIKMTNKKGETFVLNKHLAGNYTHFRKPISTQSHREVNIGPEYITQMEEGVVPIGN